MLDRVLAWWAESRVGRFLGAAGSILLAFQIAGFGLGLVGGAMLNLLTPLADAPWHVQAASYVGSTLAGVGVASLLGGAAARRWGTDVVVNPPPAPAGDVAERDAKIAELESELAPIRKQQMMESLAYWIQMGESLRSDYDTAKYPHSDTEDKAPKGWSRVDEWERGVVRELANDADERVFMTEISLAPVMDQPWYSRVAHHVQVRVDRLRDIRSRREFMPWR